MPGGPPADPNNPRTRVWTGLDALVKVFFLDENGNRSNFKGPVTGSNGSNPDPVVNYCYFQNTSLNSETPYIRRPVTGRSNKRILIETDEWELTVEHFYLGHSYEFDPLQIFSRDRKLELVLSLQAPENPADIEEQTLTPCFRVACNISGQENGVFQGSAKFAGEGLQMVTIADYVLY